MNRFACAALLGLLLFAARPGAADPVPLFDVLDGGAVAGMACTTAGAVVRDLNGTWCLDAPEDRDPYSAQPLEFAGTVSLPAGWDAAILEIAFKDTGAGLIQASIKHPKAPDWQLASRQVSYTRLNTGAARTAWFAFSLDGAGGAGDWAIRLNGLQHLTALRLLPAKDESAWTAKAASVPRDVQPMVVLERPMDLVCSAGVDVRGGMETLDSSLAALNELAPLARVLGFTAVESYVSWKRLEPHAEGEFDFSFYDPIVEKLAAYDLQWFPLLIVGSAYALPEWFRASPENVGMVCLEHGLSNPVQSICYAPHRRHVTRVLQAFGRHYGPMGVLQGVRLGSSGNYGESQYPAGGNWGVDGEAMHIHIGWWAGDAPAQAGYREFLAARYGDVASLNTAWGTAHPSFDAVAPRIPEQMLSPVERFDFTTWYTDCMSEWCEWWALEARKALPKTPIYQSAGGWGFREAGTDYSAQTKSMVKVDGGIRLTNETDSFEQNVYATRLAVTAAKHYGVDLGYEPASSHTARGVAGRLYGALTANGQHFFTYYQNIFSDQFAIAQWLDYLPLLDRRAHARTGVAIYYPETANQLGDSAFRHLYAWGFNPRAREVRRVTEVDYLDDRLIEEGFLEPYRALVFVWGNVAPASVLEKVDGWLKRGGTVIYPSFPRGNLSTVEGSSRVFKGWSNGDTGQGQFYRFRGDMEPPELYGDYVREVLRGHVSLTGEEQRLLAITRPEHVFFSVLDGGTVAALNYNPEDIRIALGEERAVDIPGYGISLFSLE